MLCPEEIDFAKGVAETSVDSNDGEVYMVIYSGPYMGTWMGTWMTPDEADALANMLHRQAERGRHILEGLRAKSVGEGLVLDA